MSAPRWPALPCPTTPSTGKRAQLQFYLGPVAFLGLEHHPSSEALCPGSASLCKLASASPWFPMPTLFSQLFLGAALLSVLPSRHRGVPLRDHAYHMESHLSVPILGWCSVDWSTRRDTTTHENLPVPAPAHTIPQHLLQPLFKALPRPPSLTPGH